MTIDKLALLREPFKANQISKLPKPTKQQTEIVRADFKAGIRCKECGAWHHPDVVHLDYVGHAALTDRLLDVDAHWNWEPLAYTTEGLPLFDQSGGLWIKLEVCGLTRLGYGHARHDANKDPGAREKEVIGDALRNAAMRFGAALDLWHKGDLHIPDTEQVVQKSIKPGAFDINKAKHDLATAQTLDGLDEIWAAIPRNHKVQELINIAHNRKMELTPIHQRIVEATTKEELEAICEDLTDRQQSEYDQLISDKMDEFQLNKGQ